MKIAEVETTPFAPRFKGNGFFASGLVLKELDGRIVQLRSSDGDVGWGEIVRSPRHILPDVVAEEDRRLAGLKGLPALGLSGRPSDAQ